MDSGADHCVHHLSSLSEMSMMTSLVHDVGVYAYTGMTVSLRAGTTQAYAGTVGKAACLTFW